MGSLLLKLYSILRLPARALLSRIPPKEIAYFYSTRIPCSALRIRSGSRALIFTPLLEQFTSKVRR